MKILLISLVTCCVVIVSMAQTVEEAMLPEKFTGLSPLLWVDHFPSPVYATKDSDEPNTYFWKHNTSIMSPRDDVRIEEGGAYLFYNNQWNLRVSFSPKEMGKLFDNSKGMLKAGQPYTFVNNWRRDRELRGGWAMWYIIGTTSDGKRVYGVGKLDTVGAFYPDAQN